MPVHLLREPHELRLAVVTPGLCFMCLKDELDWGRLNYIQIKRIREVSGDPQGSNGYPERHSLFPALGESMCVLHSNVFTEGKVYT